MSTGSADSTAAVSPASATVRPAGTADVPPLAAVAAATFGLACPPSMTRDRVEAFVDEVLSPERFADYVADPARHVLLAESEGTVLGYAMLVHGEPSDDDVRATIRLRPTVELSKIYVLPQAHGTGAAALLMARALEWAATDRRRRRLARRQPAERARPALLRQERLRARRYQAVPRRRRLRGRLRDGARPRPTPLAAPGQGQASVTTVTSPRPRASIASRCAVASPTMTMVHPAPGAPPPMPAPSANRA